jgi:DNA polymerase (family 10)
MSMLDNADVARALGEMADVLELTGGNAFKVRAYRQAAQVVDLLPQAVGDLSAQGKLTELPGIGTRIAEHIAELCARGEFREHEKLKGKVPPGVIEILSVEGVGPKTAAAAWKKLRITDLEALEAACGDKRLLKLPRMGEARCRAIAEAIRRHRARQGRTPLHRALAHAERLLGDLRKLPGVTAAEAAGSLRRRRETVADIDLLVATDASERVMRALRGLADVAATIAEGSTKAMLRLRDGMQVDVRVVPPESFGAALHYFTGSKTHNIALRTRAARMGLKLNEYGVFDDRGRRIGGAREEDVFRAVGLPFIPPELREGAGEIEAAEAGKLPRLVEEADLLGDLHVHSKTSSDGRSTLEELAEAARRLGRRYLAITDHSRSRPLGLTAADLPGYIQNIREATRARRGRPHLVAGIELDILADGALDLPAQALAPLDWVVASVHARFNQPREEMTRRLVSAIRSGVVDVIGHPSGRQLGVRDAYELDLPRVLAAAREAGVALEVNAMPERMDLTDKACRLAKEAGVKVVISSDAHNASQLENLRYGVWVARRGWLERGDVLNTRSWDDVWKLRAERRRRPRKRRRGQASRIAVPARA